jgi:hypothetical protein
MSIVCNGQIACSCNRRFDGADGCSLPIPWSSRDRILAAKLVLDARFVYLDANPQSLEEYGVALAEDIPDLPARIAAFLLYVGSNVYIDTIRRDSPRL